MRNLRPDNEKLEKIGRGLIAAGALRETEIDRIAAREDLFAGVMARVRSAEEDRLGEPFSFARFVRRHELGIGGALAAVLCVGVFGLYLTQRPAAAVATVAEAPAAQGVPVRTATRPDKMVEIVPDHAADRTADRAVDQPSVPAATYERAVYRQTRSSAPPRPQPARAEPDAASVKEFYPVTYTGDSGETVRGGRVIRVDVPRSTLFAMGLDVPLENESPTVKADLLVGPDGVTRAIRLVD